MVVRPDVRDRMILTVILVVAALLRAEYLLQIEHNIDHAYPVWQALQTLEQGALPLIGQSTSVLFANPALMGYLYLPLVALTRSPIAPYILVIALNTLAVLLAFRAVRALLGVPAALVAAALMAVNPWVIEYSRTSWVQSLLPFFTCAVAWLLWPVLAGRSVHPARRTLLALVLLTLLTQTYLLAYLLVIPVVLLVLLFRQRVPRRPFWIGCGIFLAATAIYGAGLLADADAVQGRLRTFESQPARLSGEAWSHALRLVTGSDYAAARGQAAPAADAMLRQDLSQVAHGVLLVALIIGLIWLVFRGRPARPGGVAIILLVWFFVPILLMSYVGQPVHPFYQLLGLPAGYALAAHGLTVVFRPHTRRGGALLIAAFLPFAVLMGVNSARYYQETALLPGAHGTTALSLEYGLRLDRAINAHLPSGGVIYADESPWILSSFAGRALPVIRFAHAPGVTIVPVGGGLYLNAPESPPGSQRVETLTLPDGYPLTLDRFPPGAVIQPQHVLDFASEDGIRLLGYGLERVGATVILTTFWRVDSEGAADSSFAPFAHIFDESGARLLIVDGEVVPGSLWRVGDVHVHRMMLTLPSAGPLTVRIGQYDPVRQKNVIFLPDYTALITLPEMLS